jgi:hypothetical protein
MKSKKPTFTGFLLGKYKSLDWKIQTPKIGVLLVQRILEAKKGLCVDR